MVLIAPLMDLGDLLPDLSSSEATSSHQAIGAVSERSLMKE
jgi:hypothetical protein